MKRFCFFFLFAVSVFAQSSNDKVKDGMPLEFQLSTETTQSPSTQSAFTIFDKSVMVLTVDMDGKVTYGPGYEPNEAAKMFWEYVVRYAPGTPAPKPEWVPEPSAGHYDCPDGWTAFSRSEPFPHSDSVVATSLDIATDAIYFAPKKDRKGHVLGEQPAPPVCIRDSK